MQSRTMEQQYETTTEPLKDGVLLLSPVSVLDDYTLHNRNSRRKLSLSSNSLSTSASWSECIGDVSEELGLFDDHDDDLEEDFEGDQLETVAHHKRVRFASVDEICPTLSRDDMTQKEITNYWLTDEDRCTIHRHYQRTVQFVLTNGTKLKNGKRLCKRGLECHLDDNSRHFRVMRRSLIEAVVEEQWDHVDQHYPYGFDDESIAEIYASNGINSQSQQLAEKRADKDRKEVISYLYGHHK